MNTNTTGASTAASLVLAVAFVLAANVAVFAQTYYVYVASESDDEVSLVSFDGEEARVEEVISVGRLPVENEGPHGMTIAPDGDHWFVTIAHGFPYGRVCKYTTNTNTQVGCAELGMFPASMEISTVTNLLYAVNFNLHGDHEPSTVSVVDPAAMTEVAQIPTGIMPHGSRISPDGTRVACIIDYAETVVPMAEASMYSAEDRQALVYLQKWTRDSLFLESDFTLTLLTENLTDLNQQLVQSPHTAEVCADKVKNSLALQGAGDFREAKKQATERAFSLLDVLDDLKLALLDGALPRPTLVRLMETLKSRRDTTDDPRLEAMLDEVEVRAAVELAKHDA